MSDTIKSLKTKVDIVDYIGKYTDLRQGNGYYSGKCCLHEGDGLSTLAVYPDTQSYYCFSCQSAGDIYNFIADLKGISGMAAIEELANELNVSLTKSKDYNEACKVITTNEAHLGRALHNIGKIIDYLRNERGFTDETIETWELGYSDGLIIPLRDQHSRLVAYAVRQFDKLPKYRNSKNNVLYEKSSFLYGLDKVKRTAKDKIYVVEGYLDVLSGWQMGLPTVAFCGSEITKEQVQTLTKYIRQGATIIYCPDYDDAGLRRMEQIRLKFQQYASGHQVRVLQMPDGSKDMNDLLVKGINASDLGTIHIDQFTLISILNKYQSDEEQYDRVYDFFKTVKSDMIKSDLISILVGAWRKEYGEIRQWLNAPRAENEMLKEFGDFDDCIRDLQSTIDSGAYKTGFKLIDNTIRHIRKKQVITIGAYSFAGKTDFACELALNFISQKLRVIFFSLEMPKGHLLMRLLCKILGKRQPEVEHLIREKNDIVWQVKNILDKYLVVVDTNSLSVRDIEERIKTANSSQVMGGNVDAIIVDYFTYLAGVSDFEGASNAARSLKAMAKQMDIILVMLSQLNREGSNFTAPSIKQLRMTGDLEASSDVIILLHRPGLNPALTLEEKQKLNYVTGVTIGKARDGIFGPLEVEYRYNPENSRLEECA